MCGANRRFPGTRNKVLVVEDHDLVLEAIQAMVTSLGYDVMTAANAETAFAVLAETSVDLVLADIDLGQGLSGVDLAIRVQAQRPSPAVVLMSGVKRPINAAALDFVFLMKPFSKAELRPAMEAARRLAEAGD